MIRLHPDQYPGDGVTVHYSEGLKVGYRAYQSHGVAPLFPFGYGLSYTSFRFSDLKTAKQQGRAHVTVSFRVANIGKRAGAEVAQLYLGFPPIAEGNEPSLQLKGFSKVMLNPGESKIIKLQLDQRAFSFWSASGHAWQMAPGTFHVMVGDSSANTPLGMQLTVY